MKAPGSHKWFFIDVEAPYGAGAPSVGDMTEFGAVEFETRDTFYGPDCSNATMAKFHIWIKNHVGDGRAIMWSDNPAYDWQWINFYFHKYFGENPLGYSARRIGDFYAGLVGDLGAQNKWKDLRVTKHDHNPVNDAMGNAEAMERILMGDRA